MRLPLGQWLLRVQNPPARLALKDAPHAFSLPGADALDAFAELIGAPQTHDETEEKSDVPYVPSGLFEDDLCGALSLIKEIDFGALCGDRAALTFEHIMGRGEVLLGGEVIAHFDSLSDQTDALEHAFDQTCMPCRLCVDVTDALFLGRQETLEIRFDDTRPAGVCGAVFLSTSVCAHLSRVSIQPDAQRKTLTVRARISAHHKGSYVLRVQAVPCQAGEAPAPAREIDFSLESGEEKRTVLTMEASAPRFAPGQAYAAPAVRIQLFAREKNQKGDGRLCDETLLFFGFGAEAPKSFLPLTIQECMGDAQALCERLHELHVPAVYIGEPAPDALYRALCRAGMPVLQHAPEALRSSLTRYPCVSLCDAPMSVAPPSLEAAAWQMAGSVAFPRMIDEMLAPDELLLDINGRQLDVNAEGVQETLAYLRAVQIRLRCEAARQGRYQGALCSAQEINNNDICEALRAAFAPVHLSALPLSGAWWTGTHFSASLEAFFPEEKRAEDNIRAIAVLQDEAGSELVCFEAPCKKSGYVGVIETQLPDKPCVLTLRTRLMRGENVLEESELPVYVGERGLLEAVL